MHQPVALLRHWLCHQLRRRLCRSVASYPRDVEVANADDPARLGHWHLLPRLSVHPALSSST